MKPDQAWQATLGQLQMEMPKATFNTWVRDTEMLAYEDGSFIIGVQNAYARDWLQSRLHSTVTRLLTGIMGRTVEVRFVVWQKNNGHEKVEPEEIFDNSIPADPAPKNNTLYGRYTFDSYVVGTSNRLAHAASMAVAERPAKAYNPLFLYGGVGLGKTHLLHAIGNACGEKGLQVLYVSSEEFTNDLINAIRTQTTQAFRDKYRRIDVLLVDDIQFIAGKESTQEEFFHTFNTLHRQEKQLVFSSDRPPKALVTLEERLRSRFEWGLAADIQAPDLETRLAILQSKANHAGYNIPNQALETIARRVQSNIRELEGALTRIAAYSQLSGSPISSNMVDSALVDLFPRKTEMEPAEIVQRVANTFNIPLDRLLSRERTHQVALPRQIAMFLLREEANCSLQEIGDLLGGRDHTTVMHGCEKIADIIERDERLRRQVVEIRQRLYDEPG